MHVDIILQLLLATGLWALIGLERWINEKNKPKSSSYLSFWDIRTYGFIWFFWWLTAFLTDYYSNISFVIVWWIMVATLIVIFYALSFLRAKQYWFTTELSAIVTFFLWVLVMIWYAQMAVILSVLITFLLTLDVWVEKLLKKISEEELQNTIIFAVIAIVILPLLPDSNFSIANILSYLWYSWEINIPVLTMKFFNPYSIWFFVVLMSWISYAWYIMSKLIWEKWSILASGAIWWLISSTAVTASMSESSKKDLRNTDMYVVSTLIASTIMFIRVIVIVLFFNINMLSGILVPSLFMLVWMIVYIVYFFIRSRKKNENTKLSYNEKFESPFRVVPALKFAWFVIIIKFVSALWSLYQDVWWDYFFYALWVISGLADVDAISQTMAIDALEWRVWIAIAATTIIIAVISNNLVKWFMALKFWEKRFWISVFMWFVVSMIMGIIWVLIVRMV